MLGGSRLLHNFSPFRPSSRGAVSDDDLERDPSASSVVEILDLDNPERAKLLERIDKFRDLGVGEDVELPQVRIPFHTSTRPREQYLLISWASFAVGCGWRSIIWQVVAPREYHGLALPDCQ